MSFETSNLAISDRFQKFHTASSLWWLGTAIFWTYFLETSSGAERKASAEDSADIWAELENVFWVLWDEQYDH